MPANVTGSTFSTLLVEYFEKLALKEREIRNDLLKFAKKAIIPKGNSDVIHWNRWSKFGRADSVTDGTDLSTPETPAITEIKGQLALFGKYVSVSPYGDEIRIMSVIEESYRKFIEQIAREANYRLQDTLANGDTTGSNSFTAFQKMYAGNAQSFGELAVGGTHKLTNRDLTRAVYLLRKQGAEPPYTILMNAWGLESVMADDAEFRELISNQQIQILTEDKLPYWAGARIGWQDDPWREGLASAGGAEGTYSSTGGVFTTWVFGADSFGTVQLMGRNGLKPRFKVQDISKIGTEVTIGYHIPFKGGALNPNWGVALRHVSEVNTSIASFA